MDTQHDASSYERLVKAAALLRGWHTNKEIMHGLTLGGLDVSPQKLCNWKSRGVAKPAMIDIARILGCRGEWLQNGNGEMTDEPRFALSGRSGATSNSMDGRNDSPLPVSQDEYDLLAGFRCAPQEIRNTALYMLRHYLKNV